MSRVILNRFSVLRSNGTVNSWLKVGEVSLPNALNRSKAYSVANRLPQSPLFPENNADWFRDCNVQVMDDETWRVSSGLQDACRGSGSMLNPSSKEQVDNHDVKLDARSVTRNEENPDFDEIVDMRIRRNLYYKIDRDSKEYEEYSFDFRKRRNAKNEKTGKQSKYKKKESQTSASASRMEEVSKWDDLREKKKTKDRDDHLREKKKTKDWDDLREKNKTKDCKMGSTLGYTKDEYFMPGLCSVGDSYIEKKQKTLTFMQQTAVYHEPFCLDIYISKGSVRASIIHRATSNVVVVSDSISKDLKFNMSSATNRNACAAVGEVLAHRALSDDIHNVIYTPRKGEKLEGKLQILLNSVINRGINVKVKLKQKKVGKARELLMRTQK